MSITRESFTAMIGRIIHYELDDVQQEQYAIEGEEVISSLFANNRLPEYMAEDELLFDFGIAPSALEIQAAHISFLDVIDSCFILLHDSRGKELVGLRTDVDSWRAMLRRTDTNPVLIDLLCEKYSTVISNLTSPS